MYQQHTGLAALRTCPVLVLVSLLIGCGGSSSSTPPPPVNEFLLLRTEPPNNSLLFLNDTISFDFTRPIDIKSASFDAVSFQVFDLNGKPKVEPVSGTFRLGTRPGDSDAGRRLQFVPSFPKNDSFSDGGLKPGRQYLVQLVKGDHRTGVGLRDMGNRGLDQPRSLSFRTVEGTTPAQLFRDTRPGGPGFAGISVTPTDPVHGQVALNELGQRGVEIRLRFDQPLNPSSSNLPVRLDLNPVLRDRSKRGRIFLEYDDRDRNEVWIPTEANLETNTLEGATVVLRPVGVLPNNATVRVIVEDTLQDMSGESNAREPGYNRVFAEFKTEAGYQLRFDALLEEFEDTSRYDLTAPFLEPLAEILPGAVRANFDFEGRETNLVYQPTTPEVILNTDFTQIKPKGAPPFNVSRGIFQFRRVEIPEGVTVRGTGSQPMVWLVLEDFVVKGRLLCDGGDGQRVDTLNSANFPTAGGVGVCGGGNGGIGSPSSRTRSPRGEAGFGPGQVPGGGGEGGRIACTGGCASGSGGGGGSHATKGDPWFPAKANGPIFVQQLGNGGQGCGNRSLAGGAAGPLGFRDNRVDNNYWGAAVNVWLQRRIEGELAKPRGGAGGGGGGDFSTSGCATNDPNFINDQKGGGGGAGGGVLIIKALGRIMVDRNGLISANGGNGGGGAFAGSNTPGGGGGGGSGGMVVLMAGESIDLVVHGPVQGNNTQSATYAANDFQFSVSADGGVGLQGSFGAGAIQSKYVPFPNAGARSVRPAGGMGGMGVVQLMAPAGNPGGNNVDGTNTVLDDNIHFRIGSLLGSKVTGQNKQQLLAWRGMPDANGIWRDDEGNVVQLSNGGDGEGDIRPTPILLPTPFGARSRLRSRWLDTGLSARQMTVQGGDGKPRGVQVQANMKVGQLFGPEHSFAGTWTDVAASDPRRGFLKYQNNQAGTGAELQFDEVFRGRVEAVDERALYRGQAVYKVRLAGAPLGTERDRYAHYAAQFFINNGLAGEFRILAHDNQTLILEPVNWASNVNNVPETQDLRVVARFFQVFTGEVRGLFDSYLSNTSPRTWAPKANLQIGLAFHKDPSKPDLSVPGEDQNRYPKRLGTFLYDIHSTGQIEMLRQRHLPFVQWDLLFDTRFDAGGPLPNKDSPGPRSPRPEIRRLLIPYRF